jgi:hypothetical protein
MAEGWMRKRLDDAIGRDIELDERNDEWKRRDGVSMLKAEVDMQ